MVGRSVVYFASIFGLDFSPLTCGVEIDGIDGDQMAMTESTRNKPNSRWSTFILKGAKKNEQNISGEPVG